MIYFNIVGESMVKPNKPRGGSIARFKDRPVDFSVFSEGPNQPGVLVSDPWEYLRIELKQVDAHGYADALYFVNLARSYFRGASATNEVMAQPLPYYYGYLNLVKAFLSINGETFGEGKENHGLSMRTTPVLGADVVERPKTLSIFPTFVKTLQGSVPQNRILSIDELLRANIEVHGLVVNTKLAETWDFVRVECSFRAKEKRTWIEIRHAKQDRSTIPNLFKRFQSADTKRALAHVGDADGSIVFEQRKTRTYQKSVKEVYSDLVDDARALRLHSILTRNGYRYYYPLTSWPYRQLPTAFATMFLIGSIVRYRPRVAEELFSGHRAAAVSEFISLNPRQFIYHMASLISGRECRIPFAAP